MVLSHISKRVGLSRVLACTCMLAVSMLTSYSNADDKTEKVKPSKDLYKQIEAAVAAGKITKEEAQAKLNALNAQGEDKRKASKGSNDKKADAPLETIWVSLQLLVAEGKLSQKDAEAVMGSIKQKVAGEKTANKKPIAKASEKHPYKQIEAAVIAGKLTKEEAQAKLKALKAEGEAKSAASSAVKKPKAPAKDLYKQIEAAVIAGKITKEEAQAKLKALQGNGSPKKNVKESAREESSEADQAKADTQDYLKKVWAELEEAVAAGKLTKQEALAKIKAIKKEKLGGD